MADRVPVYVDLGFTIFRVGEVLASDAAGLLDAAEEGVALYRQALGAGEYEIGHIVLTLRKPEGR